MWSEEKINSFWNPTNIITNDSTTNDEDNGNSTNIIIIIKIVIVIVLIALISLIMEKVEHIFILNLLVNLITISMLLRRNNNTNASQMTISEINKTI